MSFLQHLEVFRWHLVRSAIVILVFTILAFIFKSILFDDIILAQKNSDFWTYRMFCKFSHLIGKGDSLCMDAINFKLINISMSGQFTTHLVTAMVAGIILAFPYMLFEIWRFISPALKKGEKKYARALVFSGSVLFSGIIKRFRKDGLCHIQGDGSYLTQKRSILQNFSGFHQQPTPLDIMAVRNTIAK